MSANNKNPFEELFKAPKFDYSALISAQSKNIEAISAANQILVEGIRALSSRQAEILRNNIESILGVSKEVLTSKSPETNTAKQAELAKELYENSINNIKELSEIASKSSTEAFELLSKRAAETIEEIKAAA